MTEIFAKPELDRRTLLRRAAAVGLLATPAVGMLSACVGGGDDDSPERRPPAPSRRTTRWASTRRRRVEIVIFNGGLGTEYATDVDTPLFNKKWPDAKVTYSATEQISTVIQPRINAGNPPDMINNSGSNLMDMGAIVKAGQAAGPDRPVRRPVAGHRRQDRRGHPGAGRDRAGHVRRQAVRGELLVHRLRPLVQREAVREEQLDPADHLGRLHRAAATRSRRPASRRSATRARTRRTTWSAPS